MPTRAHFPTLIYCEPLQKSPATLARLNSELADECRKLREFDTAGRRWSARNYPGGYTSYASMNELHRFSSTFTGLEKKLTAHVRAFARTLDMDLSGVDVDGPLPPIKIEALSQSRAVGMVEAARREGPDFVVHTGDLVEDGRELDLWQEFFSIEAPLLRQTIFVPGAESGMERDTGTDPLLN